MKKFRILLFALAVISILSLTASATVYKDSLITTNNEIGIKFEVKENVLEVKGLTEKEDYQFIAITTDGLNLLPITAGMSFTTQIDLQHITNERITVGVYLGKNKNDPLTSIFYGDDIVLEKGENGFQFVYSEAVLNQNTQWLSGWVDEKKHLNTEIPEAVKTVTANITRGVESDYEKARAIHSWVADNLYYDEDYALKATNVTPLDPVEILTKRKAVCEGYSNLTVAMLNSVGIPAFVTKGYALGVDAANSWSEVDITSLEPNHAWVEAFVDGKWIIMDTTWDSYNKTFMGKKTDEENPLYRYFDITAEMLTLKHLITERPNDFGIDGVSFWAEEEVISAVGENLVLNSMYKSLKDNITRKDFCHLVVNMLTVKYSKTAEELLLERGLEINYNFFVDTFDSVVLTANALGIVNGKENNAFDPDGLITRQEAATMLYRVAKVMGVTTPNSEKLTFTDEDTFAQWGEEGIFFVSASLSNSGKRVMGGVEDGKFSPAGLYTKEQSILTIHRLFNTY